MTISASACCTVSVYGKVATEGCDLSVLILSNSPRVFDLFRSLHSLAFPCR